MSLRAIAVAAETELREVAVDRNMVIASLVQPTAVTATAMYQLRGRAGFDAIEVVIGGALAGLWSIALFAGSGIISRERWRGSLELIVMAPTPLWEIIAGRMLGNLFVGLGSIVAAYACVTLLFGFSVHVANPLTFFVSFIVAFIALAATGMLVAPIAILSRAALGLLGGLEYPIYLLAGFLAPVSVLPAWSHVLSALLPPFWAAVALRGTSTGTLTNAELLIVWAASAATSVLCLAGGLRLSEVVLERARRDATAGFA